MKDFIVNISNNVTIALNKEELELIIAQKVATLLMESGIQVDETDLKVMFEVDVREVHNKGVIVTGASIVLKETKTFAKGYGLNRTR